MKIPAEENYFTNSPANHQTSKGEPCVKKEFTINQLTINLTKIKEEYFDKSLYVKQNDAKIKELFIFDNKNPSATNYKEQHANFELHDAKRLYEVLNTEIDLPEFKISVETQCVDIRNSDKDPQLKISLEKLSIANASHKKAIESLAQLVIRITNLDSTIICKINEEGSLKTSSRILRHHLLTQHLKTANISSVKAKDAYGGKKEKKKLNNNKMFLKSVLKNGSEEEKRKFLKYICPQCSYRTWNRVGLSNHQKKQHGFKISQTYKCPDCDFTAKWQNKLKIHQIQHKMEYNWFCSKCSFKCRYKSSLNNHIRLRHMSIEKSGAFQCSVCPFKTLTVSSFERHKSAHKREENSELPFKTPALCQKKPKIFSCDCCTFETLLKSRLTQHKYWVHGKKKYAKKDSYECKQCSFKTKYSYVLRSHLLLHEDPDKLPVFTCNHYQCTYQTNFKGNLLSHLRRQHDHSKVFRCNECSYQSNAKDILIKHIFNVHSKAEARYFCDQCSYKSKCQQYLRNHKRTHLGFKDSKVLFRCAKCSYFTNNKGNLINHVKIHMKDSLKWHGCDQCAYKSKRVGDLTRHKKTHNVLYFSCSICNKQIMNHKQNLRRHMLSHTDKKKQKAKTEMCICYNCGYKSGKRTLQKHLEGCLKYLLFLQA